MTGSVPTSYLSVPGKIPEYFEKIQRGTAPPRFTQEFLEKIGFKSTNDRALIPLLKAVRFIDESNVPTQNYREYLNPKVGKVILGKQILTAYEGLFEIDRSAHKLKPIDLQGMFKSIANVGDAVAEKMSGTFTKLCSIADIDGARDGSSREDPGDAEKKGKPPVQEKPTPPAKLGLTYSIQIQLPNTTDIEVYRAIFRAVKENLTE